MRDTNNREFRVAARAALCETSRGLMAEARSGASADLSGGLD